MNAMPAYILHCGRFALAITLALASACGQGQLTTTFAYNNAGNTGGAVYFDIVVGTTITTTGLAVNVANAAGTIGAIEVWVKNGTRTGNQTNAAAWTLAGSGSCIAAGPGQPSIVSTVPGVFTPGTYGIALRGINLGFVYTNGTGANQTYATTEVTALLGEASNVPFTAPVFSPRVANFSLSYVVGNQPLVDDDCSGASVAGIGTSQLLSNVGYTTSAPAMCATGGNDRWFRFTAPTAGLYHFHTCQSAAGSVDTVLEVLAGGCGALTSLGCNDDSCGPSGLSSRVPATLAAGQTVYVRVGGYGSATGTFKLSIDRVVADFVATPTSGLAPLAVSFTNQSTSTAGALVSYAWDLDGDSVIDSTIASPAWTYAAAGNYTVSLTVNDGINPPVTTTKTNHIQVAAPPQPGDECGTASDVFVGDNGPFTNVGYTASAVGNACGAWGAGDKDRWFRFVPSYSYSYRFSVVNATMTGRLEVRDGACGSQTSLGCGSSTIATLNGGTAYFVRVAGTSGTTGSFTLRIRPVDDECDGAMPIAVGITPTAHGADYSASAATICGAPTFVDRWFTFTPPFAAPWTFSGHGTSVVEVVSGCGGTLLACGLGSATTSLNAAVTVRLRLGMSAGVPNPTVVVAPGKGPGTAAADVVFNEVCYDDQGTGHEFVELFNTTTSAKSIAGWYVVAVTSSAQTTVLLAPPTATVQPHGVWHAGAGSTTSLLLPLPNGATSLRLHDQNGALVDTLHYEAVSGLLGEVFRQGHPLFGEHKRTPGLPTSWGRNNDGHVTDTGSGPDSDNGFEWRIGAATPGLSNDLPDTGYVQTSYENISTVPEWGGCQVAPTLVTPTPASNDGGQCLEFAAPSAPAGRSWFYKAIGADNYQLDAYVWLDLPAVPSGGYCVWSLGLCGTTDSEYRAATPWRTRTDENGDTGVTWVYEVLQGPGALPYGTLSLVDNGAGGTDHIVLWSETITSSNAGWRRLGLGVAPKSLVARVGGTVGAADVDDIERPHDHAHGGIYVGIRQSHNVNFKMRIDGSIVDRSWNSHDTTGSGCDGNCPPRNASGGVLNRKVAPEAKTYALLLPNDVTFSASKFCFYMAGTAPMQTVPPFVQLCTVVGSGPNAVPNTVPLRAGWLAPENPNDTQAWWILDLGSSGLTHGTDLFVKVTLPATIQPPILQERTDGLPLEQVAYRPLEGSAWGAWDLAPFAFKWTCAGDSSDLEAGGKTDESIDLSTIDFTLSMTPVAATPAVLVLSTTALTFPLDSLGAPTCKLYTGLDSLSLQTIVGGTHTVSFTIPNAAPLIGVSLHSQWAVLNPAVNPLGLRTSNRHTFTIRSP
ncbi:MAG: lamin tail domain-containing protein [Planctomycetes bacterium]|nr:lamin tail domain-containing protein [Planctomycetota bacterium]